MSDKFDLARMLREIREETESKSAKSRTLSQEEIGRIVAEKKKSAVVAKVEASKSQP